MIQDNLPISRPFNLITSAVVLPFNVVFMDSTDQDVCIFFVVGGSIVQPTTSSFSFNSLLLAKKRHELWEVETPAP